MKTKDPIERLAEEIACIKIRAGFLEHVEDIAKILRRSKLVTKPKREKKAKGEKERPTSNFERMNMSDELKACPHCGCLGTFTRVGDVYVRTCVCGISTSISIHKPVTELWNRRIDPIRDELARMLKESIKWSPTEKSEETDFLRDARDALARHEKDRGSK